MIRLMPRDTPNIIDLLHDAQEGPFLVRALARAPTDEERERYAECLESRDPARAEWLRLERALHSRAAADPAVRRRFDALTAALAGDWVRLLRRDTLLNCGRARGEPRRVRFAFACERTWESLAPSEDPRVRTCDACEQRVHRCETVAEADAHARAGRCVAVPSALVATASGRDTSYMVGRPDLAADWAARLFGDD